jgi:hypothetical protein
MKENQYIASLTDVLYDEDLRDTNDTWTHQVTKEQGEINDWLIPQLNKQNKILFVGTGDSSLALKTHNLVDCIDGITIIRSELELGVNCNLPNYHLFCLDKHSNDILNLSNKYTFIVDNNLTSYTKDIASLTRMLNNYLMLLEDKGKIIGSLAGLSYVYQGNEAGINSLDSFNEFLQNFMRIFPYYVLKLTKETNTIFSISLYIK